MLRCFALWVAFAACTDDVGIDESTQDVDVACPGVSSGVSTYRGLTGTYQRLGSPGTGEPLRLTLFAYRDDTDARGTFTGRYTSDDGTTATYGGAFAALADNPAIGAVLSLDTNFDQAFDHTYFVLGVARTTTPFGSRVRGLCLLGAEPFLLQRLY